MSRDVPQRMGDGPLAEAREKLGRLRDAPPVGDDLEGDDLAELRAQGVEQMRRQRWLTMIPSRFQWATLTDLEPGVSLDALRGWSDKPAGRNLVLLGPVGTGKTHAGVAAARGPFDRGLEVEFLPVVEALDMLRPSGDPHALETLMTCDLLFLDDLGSERPTDWTAERLFAVVNRRWLEERPTIVSANLEPGPGKSFMEAVGERTYSRLVGNDAVVVRLTGADRRRARS